MRVFHASPIPCLVSFALPLLALALPVGLSGQKDNELTRPALKGVASAAVDVALADDVRTYTSADRLKTVIELSLREHGFQIAPSDQADVLISFAILALPEMTNRRVTHFSVATNFEVNQPVHLVRDPSILSLGATWGLFNVGTWGVNRVSELAERVAREGAEQFINAVLSVR